MTWIAIRVVISAISGIVILDLIRPDVLILFLLIGVTFIAGIFEKRLLYLTVFLLSGLNYLSVYPRVQPFHYVSGTGTVVDSRPQYGRYLTLVRSRNGIFELVTRQDLRDRRVYFRGFVKKDKKSKIIVEPTSIAILSRKDERTLFTIVREKIIQATGVIKDDKRRGLLISLLLGRSYYPKTELWDFFARAGVIHLLTVSGLHVGFILSLGLLLFTGVGLRRRTAYIIGLALIPIYAGVTGFRPPVVRASIMLGMITISMLIERKTPPIHFLVIALLLLVVFDPLVVFNPGAQLSFAAAFGITLLYNEFKDHLSRRRMLRYLTSSLLVSSSATMATAPLLIFYFGRLPTFGIFTNLIVVPLAWFSVGLGLIMVIAYQLSGPLAQLIGSGLDLLLYAIIFIARQVSSIPCSSLKITWVPAIICPSFYLLFIKRIRIYGAIALFGLTSLLLILPTSYRLTREGSRLSVDPPGIDLSTMIEGRYPVDIMINDLTITRIGRTVSVRIKSVDEKIKEDGVYYITGGGIVSDVGDNIILKIFNELKLLWLRMGFNG